MVLWLLWLNGHNPGGLCNMSVCVCVWAALFCTVSLWISNSCLVRRGFNYRMCAPFLKCFPEETDVWRSNGILLLYVTTYCVCRTIRKWNRKVGTKTITLVSCNWKTFFLSCNNVWCCCVVNIGVFLKRAGLCDHYVHNQCVTAWLTSIRCWRQMCGCTAILGMLLKICIDLSISWH